MPRISRPWRSQATAPVTGHGTVEDQPSPSQQPVQQSQSAPPTDPPRTDQGASATPVAAQPPAVNQPPGEPTGQPPAASERPPDVSPGFAQRGRVRRRLHFLRKARELAYRDLGGLIFDLHRFGQRHDELVAAKLATLTQIDSELRTLEGTLRERRSFTVLHEAGIAACPRCAAIHASDDRFCPSCGMPMGYRADRPLAATAGPSLVTQAQPLQTPPAQPPVPPPVPLPQPAQTPPPPQTQTPDPPAATGGWPNRVSSFAAPRQPAPPQTQAPGNGDLLRPAGPPTTPDQTGEEQPTQIISPSERPGNEDAPGPPSITG